MRTTRSYSVERFCNLKNKKTTREYYYAALLAFARQKFPTETDPITSLNAYVVRNDADPITDIRNFINSRSDKPKTTTNNYCGVIRQFFEINDHAWNRLEMRAITPKTAKSETEDEPITLDILKKMMDVGDIHGRLILTLLVSTGCRVGELSQVRLSDVNLNADPVSIKLRDTTTKNGEARTVFITPECESILRNWLSGPRAQYIRDADRRNKGLIGIGKSGPRPESDDRLLGCTGQNIRYIFMSLFRRAGMDVEVFEKTNRHVMTPHSTRKYFRTVAVSTMPLDVVESIMGHMGYLTAAYVRLTDADLAKVYKKGCHILQISDGEEVRAIRDTQHKQDDKISRLERDNDYLKKMLAKLFSERITSDGISIPAEMIDTA